MSQMYSVVFGDDLECFLGRLLGASLRVENGIDASGFAFSDLGISHLSHQSSVVLASSVSRFVLRDLSKADGLAFIT